MHAEYLKSPTLKLSLWKIETLHLLLYSTYHFVINLLIGPISPC